MVKGRGGAGARTESRAGDRGQRTAVNVSGADVADLSRGQTLVTPGAFGETRIADAIVDVLPGAALRHGARVRFHQGTAEILGRGAIVGPIDAGGAVPAIAAGARAFVRLRLESPAVLVRGDRYILRAYSPPVTIAGGLILDPRPPRGAIRNAGAVARCERLAFDPSADRAEADLRALRSMIDDAGLSGFAVGRLTSRAGIDPRDVDARIAALESSGASVRAGEVLVAAAALTALEHAILATLTKHHAAQSLSEGMPRDELREQTSGRGHAAIFDRALDDLGGPPGSWSPAIVRAARRSSSRADAGGRAGARRDRPRCTRRRPEAGRHGVTRRGAEGADGAGGSGRDECRSA